MKAGSLMLLGFATALASFTISSCATAPVYLSQQVIARSYIPYAFGPIANLVERIGAPTRSMQLGNQTVYVWHGTATWEGRYPTYNVMHGTLSTGNAMDGAPLQYTEAVTGYRTETSDLACDLEVYVDASGTINNVMVRGQNGACQQFMLP
jgi:hypothetical protein